MSSLPQEIHHYIKESIHHSLGLPVSTHTLQLKIIASEAAQLHLRSHCLSLQAKLNQQILATQSSKAEAKLSAQGLKKAIEKNGQLSEENSLLISECKRWKTLANKWKMAVDRAKEETAHVRDLEQELNELTDDLSFFKNQYQMRKFHLSSMEEDLVESVLADLIGETELFPAGEFLLQNAGYSSCRRLLYLSKSLSPATQKALSMAAKIKALEKNKQQLEILLRTAQGEVKLLSEQINYLVEEQTSPSHEERGQRCGGKPPASSPSMTKLHESVREQSNLDD